MIIKEHAVFMEYISDKKFQPSEQLTLLVNQLLNFAGEITKLIIKYKFGFPRYEKLSMTALTKKINDDLDPIWKLTPSRAKSKLEEFASLYRTSLYKVKIASIASQLNGLSTDED